MITIPQLVQRQLAAQELIKKQLEGEKTKCPFNPPCWTCQQKEKK